MAYSIKEIQEALVKEDLSVEVLQELLKDERKSVQRLVRTYQSNLKKREDDHALYDQMLQYEKEAWSLGYTQIAGVDEVGRGPLAGPVVAAAVILPRDEKILGLNDSKKLSDKKREALFTQIVEKAVSIGVGIIPVHVIDQINIYEATKVAMKDAIQNLKYSCDYLCIDAMKLDVEIPQNSIIKGDANSVSIAAASIIAKVTRDQMMKDLGKEYPEYGFERHMGYGTKEHLIALQTHGVTPHHRKSFAPVKQLISGD